MKDRGWLLPALAVGFFCLGIVLAFFAPPEESLGAVYRIVTFHGGLAMVSFALLAAGGIVGLVALAKSNPETDAWTAAAQETGALYFFLYFVSAFYAMIKAWYGPLLEEPRFLAAVVVMFVGGVAYVVSLVVHKPRVRAALTAAVGALAIYLLVSAPLFFHPKNAIRESASVSAKVFLYTIAACMVLSAASFFWWRLKSWRGHLEPADLESTG